MSNNFLALVNCRDRETGRQTVLAVATVAVVELQQFRPGAAAMSTQVAMVQMLQIIVSTHILQHICYCHNKDHCV